MTTTEYIRKVWLERPFTLLKVATVSALVGVLESSGIAMFIPLLQMVESQGQNAGALGRLGQAVQSLFSLLNIPFSLGYLLVFIFLIVVLSQLMTLVQALVIFRARYGYEAEIRNRLYEAFFAADWSFFLKQKLGDLTNTITTEVVRAGSAFHVLGMLISTTFMIGAYLFLALMMSWQMTLIAGVLGIVIVLALQKRVMKARKYGESITQANADLQSEALEQLSSAKLVKGSAVEKETTQRFRTYLESVRVAYYKSYINQALLRSLYEPLAVGILCISIYFAISTLAIPLAKLIVFLFLFYRLSPRLSNLQSHRHELLLTVPATTRIDELHAEARARVEVGGSREVSNLMNKLVFENVTFEYVEGYPVIRNLSIDVLAHKSVAIVGGSGAGKSTVIDLIMGLIVPKSGSITIDGVPLSEIDLSAWRRMISYVPQETILLHASVKENIMWTSPEASHEDVIKATRDAHALEFIEELPLGFDTVVGDRGVRLSGGQKQRLALARALLRKPKLLILDEATSALDAESEKKIQTAVENLSQSEMTIVIVTHRLATVRNSDIIYVLEQGELIETGSWVELTNAQGRFSTLKQLQALD